MNAHKNVTKQNGYQFIHHSVIKGILGENLNYSSDFRQLPKWTNMEQFHFGSIVKTLMDD